MSEETLTNSLVDILSNGGLKKLTRTSNKQASLYREIGNNGCIADIFVTLQNQSENNFRDIKSIAIEVKIKDWSSGLYQAWRYRNFAEKSYLAIYEPYAKNLKMELFEDYNVGVIVFDENKLRILRHPKEKSIKKETYEYFAKQKVLGNLINSKQLLPSF